MEYVVRVKQGEWVPAYERGWQDWFTNKRKAIEWAKQLLKLPEVEAVRVNVPGNVNNFLGYTVFEKTKE